MSTLMRPMLAAKTPEESVLKALPWPLWASAKIDGIRALVCGGRVLSRSMKLIPSRWVQRTYGGPAYEGFDGELFHREGFRTSTSAVMSREGGPVTFAVFDLWNVELPYERRLELLVNSHFHPEMQLWHQAFCRDYEQMLRLEQRALDEGYEGLILRSGEAFYKQGRSTLNELALLKVKRFEDAEAEVLDAVELRRNNNPPLLDERGYTKRSSHQLNKAPGDTLGTLLCKTAEGKIFEIGTGFTEHERTTLWSLYNEGGLRGLTVKYKHLPQGGYDVPRHAVFLGFRAPIDI